MTELPNSSLWKRLIQIKLGDLPCTNTTGICVFVL